MILLIIGFELLGGEGLGRFLEEVEFELGFGGRVIIRRRGEKEE